MKRTQNFDALENPGRYIASAELADLRGVPAVPVSFRAAALLSAAKRDFIWWLQGLSLADGGFPRVARELLEMFPERIGSEDMHNAKIQPGKMYSEAMAPNFDVRRYLGDYEPSSISGAELIQRCRQQALTHSPRQRGTFAVPVPLREISLEQFLVELCINPKITFTLPGEDGSAEELEIEQACENGSARSAHDFERADLIYFRGIIGALVTYSSSPSR